MRRRAFLAGVAAGLAGCSATQDGSPATPTLTPVDPPADTSPETPTATPTDSDDGDDDDSDIAFGEASIVDLKTGDRTLALAPQSVRAPDGAEVSVRFTGTATSDHPARLTVQLTNANDWENTFRLRTIPGFHEVNFSRLHREDRTERGDARETSLFIVPTADHNLVDAAPEFERGPDGFWRVSEGAASIPELPGTVHLAPGETVGGEYVLLGGASRTGFPLGTYRFGDDDGFRIAVWQTEAPGPDVESPFEDRVVPDLPDEHETLWYHQASRDTEVYLEPDTQRIEAPWRATFRFVNHSREPVGGNPYSWRLYKRSGEEWFRIAPWLIPAPLSVVATGGEYVYDLRLFHGAAVPCEDHESGLATAQGHLGGGTYAFEAGYSWRSDSDDTRTTAAALFELEAPPVEVEPEDDVKVEWDGDTARVTTPAWRETSNDREVLEAIPTDTGGSRILAEQIYRRRYDALRNVVPFFEDGASRVIVRTEQNATWDVPPATEHRYFSYRGQSYEIRPLGEDGAETDA